MDWEQSRDNWVQIEGSLKARWNKLTDQDLEGVAGQRNRLIDRLQAVYGWPRVQAESELRDWERHQEPIGPVGPAKKA